MKSIIYWHPAIYTFTMKFLYKKNFIERYRIIAELIPEEAEIIDFCCGDCYIYFHFLKDKNVKYLGLDMNETFVNIANKKGVTTARIDVLKDELPSSDYILMLASMYHFIPNEEIVIKKILDSAKKRAIISEPVINYSTSQNIIINKISKILTNAGTEHSNERFNKKSLLDLFYKYNVTSIYEIEGGRDIIGVFDRDLGSK